MSEAETKQEPEIELVTITVDGKAVQAPKGKNLLMALIDEGGVDISYFCYHPGLSVAACCRQCMVKVGGRMAPSCQMQVAPDMVVESEVEDVLEVRRKMLEFTLLNHPVDCVMCDKAGECTLQRHYMDWDGKESALNTKKVDKPKKVDIGPDIVLDAERCIMCSRCIRFCAEVAKQPDLVFEYRANHKVLTTAPGSQLDNPYSLNTVDICPVGALTDKDFRFKIRVWELFSTESVCNGCARGCRMEIHHRDGAVHRLVPPKRMDMNLNWMCNYGRRTYKRLGDQRLIQPQVDGKPASLDDAVAAAAQLLAPLRESEGAAIGVVIGADTANEDCFAGVELARALGAGQVYLAERPDDGQGDEILRRDDPNPNRAGAKACGGEELKTLEDLAADLGQRKLKLLYVLSDRLELSDETLSQMGDVALVLQACHDSRAAGKAKVVLPAAKWAEVNATVTDLEGTVKRMRQAIEPPGHARPHWDLVGRVTAALGEGLGFTSAEAIFEQMSTQIEAFADASWGGKKPTQMLRFRGRRG